MPNSKRTKQRAFAILLALLMMVSFIANVGAVVSKYAKPGDIIDILSWNIVGTEGTGTTLKTVTIDYTELYPEDVKYSMIFVGDKLFGTLYGFPGTITGIHEIAADMPATVTLKFKISETAGHGHMVDGVITDYTLTYPGAGGTDTAPIISDGPTIIDAVKPEVVSVIADPVLAKAGPVTVTVVFKEGPMDNLVNPTVTVGGLSQSYTVDKISYIDNIWTGIFTLEDEGDTTHAHISVSDGQDLAGNVMLAELEAGTFDVDTEEPTVTTLTVSPKLLSDLTSAFTVTVDYSEAMGGVNPDITFDKDIYGTLTLLDESWVASTYTATYTVIDVGVKVDDVGVTVSLAEDLAGNVQDEYTKSDAFDIDTENPTVDSAYAVPDLAKAGSVDVTVVFNEDMDTAVPLIVDVTGLKSLYTVGQTSYADNIWTGTFTLKDEGEEELATISVSGGQDIAGNVMVPGEGNFDVDTIEPTVTIGVIDTMITEADSTFDVTATFSETMDKDYPPDISFSPEASTTLTSLSYAWSMDDTVYTATYTIADYDVEYYGVSVTVGGAKDLAGNLQDPDPFTSPPLFGIDTYAPWIQLFKISHVLITESDILGPPFCITLVFSEPIFPTVPIGDVVSFSPYVSGTLSFMDALVNPLELQFNYVISDGDQETSVDVHVEGLSDANGNPLVLKTYTKPFYIDNLEPTVTVTIADPINLANVANVPVTIESDDYGTYSCVISDGVDTVSRSGDIYDGVPIDLFLDLGALKDGTITANALVVDAVGNVGHAQDTATKDATAPEPYLMAISLQDDADGNGIANIGDTLRVDVDMNGHFDTVSVTADLRAYGGSTAAGLNPMSPNVWSIDFVIVDSPTGIDEGAEDPLSAVTVTATDDVGNTATATSDPLISDHGVDSLAPEPLSGLTATAIADGKIRLDWTASVAPDLVSYIIYRDDTEIATVDLVESWTDEDPLLDGETYNYRMKSVDDAKNIGDYSNEASATSDSTPPNAPINLFVGMNPPETQDTIEGLEGAVEPYAEITVYSDDGLSVMIGTVMAIADGSFPAIDIGNNLYAEIWVTATDAAGNEGLDASELNDIEAPEITSIHWSVEGMPEVIRAGDEITITLIGELGCTATFDIVPNLVVGGLMVQDPDGTYTGSHTVKNGEDGTYLIKGHLKDAAGNEASIETTEPFRIDTKPPTVSIKVSDTMISDADVPNTFEVTATFSESMNPTIIPDIDFTPSIPNTLALADGLWSDLDTVYTATYTVEDDDVEVTGVDVSVSGAQDLAGNSLEPEPTTKLDAFSIDTLAPKAPTDLIAPAYINIANQHAYPVSGLAEPGSTVKVRVGFVTKTGLANPSTGEFSIEVDASDLAQGSVAIDARATDAEDNTGPWSEATTRMKDTIVPKILRAYAVPDPAKAGPVTVNIKFSEAMGVSPTVRVTGLATTYTVDEFSYVENIWTGTFFLLDQEEEKTALISVSGGEDLAGNVRQSLLNTGTFKVDTIEPTVTVGVSDTMITEADSTFDVTATFSETMNKDVEPTISFSLGVSTTLTDLSGVWDVDGKVYTATYTIADVDQYVSGVAITVESAEDIAGNLQVKYVTDALFDVDTLHGTSEPKTIEVKVEGADSFTTLVGSEVDIKATVKNWFNELVPDGVEVSFATDLGTIYPLTETENGIAQTSILSQEIGTATVTATVGVVSDSCTITFVKQTLEIKISRGWNLISVPRTLADPAIGKVFAGITTIEKVYTYEDRVWYCAFYYEGTWDTTIDDIEDGKGYWVYASAPTTVTITLDPLGYVHAPPPDYWLPTKWSLIGYTSLQMKQEMTIDGYLDPLSWNALYVYDPADRMYEQAKQNPTERDFDNFELGRGYWIYLNKAGTLVP